MKTNETTTFAEIFPSTPGWYAMSRINSSGCSYAAYWDGNNWAGRSKWSDYRSIQVFSEKDEAIDFGISWNL